MKLSSLQKFILKEGFGNRGKILRHRFHKFYDGQKIPLGRLSQVKIISKSIDRLIDKGLLLGFGEKTQHKWFIKEVQLTALGRGFGKKLLGEQKSLPFKKRKK
ncbi:MAG TPA: hypothetical protein VJB39_02030 [Patescibacteria group bacterium]|nr:hypothetical protein [Patescibacteria group bacterium]